MTPQIKREGHRLSSQYLDGSLMYPGVTVLTWVSAPWGWMLIGMEQQQEPKK